ncbi:hypothetical protein RJ641_018943, partial [Dillenia turbinata]
MLIAHFKAKHFYGLGYNRLLVLPWSKGNKEEETTWKIQLIYEKVSTHLLKHFNGVPPHLGRSELEGAGAK